MALKKKYSGEFLSRDSVKWRCEIWQGSDVDYTVKELSFPADAPLTIEWRECDDKTEPVMSSAATLVVISETDREFVDLYQVKIGQVRLDVYREDALYWSGMLDTEIYEEPFSTEDGYDVSITFSDFAILDRIKYKEPAERFVSLKTQIDRCLAASGINFAGYEERITTAPSGGGSLTATCCVLWENFFDEENEAMTMREVLDAILRPFGLRMIQKGGKIICFDLEGLYNRQEQPVYWSLADSVLSVDRTYNNVGLTFSPYKKNDLIDASIEYSDVKDGTGTGYLIKTDYSAEPLDGFEFYISKSGGDKFHSGIANGAAPVYYFAITPHYSGGEKTAGIIFRAVTGTVNGEHNVAYTKRVGQLLESVNSYPFPSQIVRYNKRPYIMASGLKTKYYLRLTLDALFDCRMNFLEEISKDNEKEQSEAAKKHWNQIYMRCCINLKDAAGNSLYHYKNSDVFIGEGRWEPGGDDGTGMDAWLVFYDLDDRRESSIACTGWSTNKHFVGVVGAKRLPKLYSVYPDGDLIPMPPASGFLEISIIPTTRLFWYSKASGIYEAGTMLDEDQLRWCLIKDLKLSVVDEYGNDLDDDKDVVTRAYVEKDAKESMSIDTVVGTMPEAHPTARGQVFDASGAVMTEFVRGGVTDSLENLLCGTAFSQYHGRKRKLSGTARLLTEFTPMTDEAEPGKYIVTSESQDVIEDETELVMVELSPENYKGKGES